MSLIDESRPLSGRTVIDLTIALAGPYATLLLAGLGARVIKVENPRGGEQSRTNSPYLGEDGVKLASDATSDVSLAHLNRSRGKERDVGADTGLRQFSFRSLLRRDRVADPGVHR